MVKIKVTRMNGGGCAKSVTRAIHRVEADAAVVVDLAAVVVAITSPAGASVGRFVDAVRAAGYGADGGKSNERRTSRGRGPVNTFARSSSGAPSSAFAEHGISCAYGGHHG